MDHRVESALAINPMRPSLLKGREVPTKNEENTDFSRIKVLLRFMHRLVPTAGTNSDGVNKLNAVFILLTPAAKSKVRTRPNRHASVTVGLGGAE